MLEPDGSVLPPAAFLPTAERFGLIREIDRWVIDRAIEVAAGGRAVTINLSARSISDPGLSDHIGEALDGAGADPAQVVFELTETAAATASEDLHEFGGPDRASSDARSRSTTSAPASARSPTSSTCPSAT